MLYLLSSLISISFSRSSSHSLFIFTCKSPLPEAELRLIQSLQSDYLCRSFKISIVKQLFSLATCTLSREASRWDSRAAAARASVNINPACFDRSSQTFCHCRRAVFECWSSSDDEVSYHRDMRIIAAVNIRQLFHNVHYTLRKNYRGPDLGDLNGRYGPDS